MIQGVSTWYLTENPLNHIRAPLKMRFSVIAWLAIYSQTKARAMLAGTLSSSMAYALRCALPPHWHKKSAFLEATFTKYMVVRVGLRL